jgi:hypothetical protein
MGRAPRGGSGVTPPSRRLTAHDVWPTPGTVLLVRAALLEGPLAVSAFDAWLASGPPGTADRLPSPDRRLLPLVAANLRALGVERAYLAVCDEVRRRSEERNGRLLRGAADALAALRAADVDALALKGVPLLVQYYRDAGLRPMTDVDLMVRPAAVPRALAALRAAGWRDRPVPGALRRAVCAYECERADGANVDLHQYLVEYGSSPAVEDDLWRRAQPLDVLGVPARAPAAGDLLLHTCLAGLKYGRHRNSRWIVDALVVLRHAGAGLDWPLLVDEARRREVVLPLRECLHFLVETFDAPVPAAVSDALWRAPVRAAERRRYRALTRNAPSAAQLLAEYWTLYAFAARASGARRTPVGFLDYVVLTLAYRWRLPNRRRVPAAALARLVRRRARPRSARAR